MAEEVLPGTSILGDDIRPDQKYKVTKYNFKRPDKFSKEQVRTLSIIHETFSRIAMTSLAAMLRSPAHVDIEVVDQMTYEEFVGSMANPTSIGIFVMDPLKGVAILEFDPAFTFAVIDRLLGGGGEPIPDSREMTEVEHGLIESVYIRLLGNLRESWIPVIDLRPRLCQIETIPHFAQIVPPTEIVVLIRIKAKIGDVEGMMQICIPYMTVEAIANRLTAVYMYSTIRRKAPAREISPELIRDLQSETEVCITSEPLSLNRIGALKKGDRIHLPGWKHGLAFIRSGKAAVLNLKRQHADGELVFTVDRPKTKRLEFLLAPGKEDSTSQFKEALESITRELGEGFNSVRELFKSLQEDQLEEPEVLEQPAEPEPAPERNVEAFASITPDTVDWYATFLEAEHPQLIAMIMCSIKSDLAADLLDRLSDPLRSEVVRRITSIGRVAPAVVEIADRILWRKLRDASVDEAESTGGIEAAAAILNHTARDTEAQVIQSLRQNSPELAESIQSRMFVFDDIAFLNAQAVRKVYQRAGANKFAAALKDAAVSVVDFIAKNLEQREAEDLQTAVNEMKPIKLAEVESVQREIVEIIEELDRLGEITVVRREEE